MVRVTRPNGMLRIQRVCLLQTCVRVSMFHSFSFKLVCCFHPTVCHGLCTAIVSSHSFCAGKASTHWPGDKVSHASLSRRAPGATGTGRSSAIGFVARTGGIGSCFQAPAVRKPCGVGTLGPYLVPKDVFERHVIYVEF